MTKPGSPPQYRDVSESDPPPGTGLEAFDAIYEADFDYVWRTLGRFGVAVADLQDAVHEVFLVLYRRWNEVDRTRSMRPWLFGVARRVAADLRAKRRDEPAVVEPITTDDPFDTQRDMLWRGLQALDDDRRTVLVLHDLEGHTGAEIAARLDLSVNTVHSRLRLARADLLAAVRKLGGGR